MTLPTAATELLGIDHPIVSAPMAGVGGGRLAAAVSTAGGLGLIGGGYGDEAWLRHQFDLADGARVGCGFITWALASQPQLLDVALTYRPVAVMLSFGDPAPFAAQIRSSGARLICQVQNLEQATAALQAGADVLVAQGNEAGGHGYGHRSTMTLVPELVDVAAGTPVLAAGGIADGRGLAAALMLGAAGVLMGTRFYAAAEALSPPHARDTLVSADGDSTCRTTVYDIVRGYRWPEGHTMNVLRNAFTDRWDGAESTLHEQRDDVTAQYQRAVADDDYRTANVTAGQAVGLIHSTASAGDIVASIVGQAAALLGRETPKPD
ncbi:NAD(P)H-dependent flavin oxidoreductase [Mycobacterium sp. pUA109]|uniref:NAD(P)H-dependent flavin oxidoreductase n=1 Tax=Mycobacterium sp. pUA109 TaxID=3238982 RepID=UPI00351B3A17